MHSVVFTVVLGLMCVCLHCYSVRCLYLGDGVHMDWCVRCADDARDDARPVDTIPRLHARAHCTSLQGSYLHFDSSNTGNATVPSSEI